MLFRMLKKLLGTQARAGRKAATYSEALEDRTLLSNMNLTVAGNIVLGGGAEANDFVIDFDGTNYIVTDTTGTAINAIGGLAGFDTNAAANIVTFDPTLVAAFTQFQVNGNAGDDSLTINGFRAGAEGLTVVDTAGQGFDTVTINGDIGTAGSRVSANNVVIRADAINLGANIYTNNRAVTLGGSEGLVLTAGVTVDAGTGAVTFEQAVDGGQSLTVVGGAVIFNGHVGGNTPLTTFDVSGSTSIRTQNVTATAAITIQTNSYTPMGTLDGDDTADLTIRRQTAGTQTFTADSFPYVSNSFNSVTIGSALTTTLNVNSDGDNSPTEGSFRFDADLTLIGDIIKVNDSIQQAAHTLTFRPETALNFNGIGRTLGSGDVNIIKQNAGGTLTVTGNIGFAGLVNPWGTGGLALYAVGSTATFTGGVGSSFTSINAAADILNFNHASAVTAQQAILLTADNVNLNGGIYSATHDVIITGDVTLTGNVLLKAGAGRTVQVTGEIIGNGSRNLTIRGEGGALGLVDIASASNIGKLNIDSNGASTAALVELGQVSANGILVRGVAIELKDNLTALNGGVQLVGAVQIDRSLTLQSSGAPNSVRVDGTVNAQDGDENLTINSGSGATILNGVVGGGTALNDLTVNSGGVNTILQNITVGNDFLWDNGTGKLTLNTGKIINAGNDLEIIAGQFVKNGSLVAGGVITTP